MTPYSGFDPTVDDEPEMPDCPYCHAQVGVTFLRHEHEGDEVEVYKCYTCDTIFKVKVEIPFLKDEITSTNNSTRNDAVLRKVDCPLCGSDDTTWKYSETVDGDFSDAYVCEHCGVTFKVN